MAETNLITSADLARAREIEFVAMFGESVKRALKGGQTE